MNTVSNICYLILFTLAFFNNFKDTLARHDVFNNPDDFQLTDSDGNDEVVDDDIDDDNSECLTTLQNIGGFNANSTGVQAFLHSYFKLSVNVFNRLLNSEQNVNGLLNDKIKLVKSYTKELLYYAIHINQGIINEELQTPIIWCDYQYTNGDITINQVQECKNCLQAFGIDIDKALTYGFKYLSEYDQNLNEFTTNYYKYLGPMFAEMNHYFTVVPNPRMFCSTLYISGDLDDLGENNDLNENDEYSDD